MEEKIYFDKTEFVYRDMADGREIMRNVPYNKVISILVGRKLVKKFLGLSKKVTPAILINVTGMSLPFEILECEEGKETYEIYLSAMRKFAHDNHVTIRDADPGDIPYGAKEDWRLK
ncbi:MAG: hypothetical protein ACYCWE_00485 [Eubacteriales bacterium]